MDTQAQSTSEEDSVVPDGHSGSKSVKARGWSKRTAAWIGGVGGGPGLAWLIEQVGWAPAWSWTTSLLAAIPPIVWWVLIAGLSLASAFTAGQQMDRFRSRRKQITEEEAADLVCESNYWSRLQRRSRVGAIQASIDSERYGFDPDPVDMQAEAISPPRHTADVDAILQQFWDDNPDARQDGLYRRDVLQAWLVEQAQQVTVTTRLSW